MPNQKVPQLPILTAITDADLFYVVDVSDTTDDPTGSSKQVTREEILTNVSHIDFNLTAVTSHEEGRVSWNDEIKSLEVDTENPDVQVQVGHEMVVRVNNQTGSILTKGTVVYINGAQGQRPTVTKADYSADTSSASVIGLVAADINNGENGYVVTQGILEGLDTNAYSAGTSLYLFTGGTYSSNKPQAPDHDVRIGKVIVSNATTGSIYVNVQNGYELDELHDVRITSVSENDVLVRSSYNGTPVWVNTKTISGLTYVGATTISATTISGTTFYGDGTNLTGVVKGSGTSNYLPKWTGTTGLGNSIIQDNGTQIGVGGSPNTAYKMIIYGGGGNGIYGYSTAPNKYGVLGGNFGDDLGTYAGGYFSSTYNDSPNIDNIYIGAVLYANADAGGTAYGAQIQDGTQGLNKVLISATADGKTNWSSNLTGLTSVSASTLSGGTVTSSGDVTAAGVLKSTQSSGDEGGEIQLSTAQTNTSLSGTSVTIDIYQNKLRIFESGGSNRGVFVDITESIGGVGTDLLNPFIPSLTPQEIYRGVTFQNNSTTVTTTGGVTMSTTASNLAISVSSANFYEKQIRLRYYSTTVSGGRYTGTRGSALLWYIHGGFRYICDFRISDTGYSSTAQQFYGMAGVTADLGYGGVGLTQVSTLTNIIGVGNDGDDTNLQIIHNDSSGVATKVDLGVDFPANRPSGSVSTDVYSVTLYNAETSSNVKYMVINKTTGAVATGTITTDLPATTQGLNFFASRAMGGSGGVTGSGQFELMKLGVFSLL